MEYTGKFTNAVAATVKKYAKALPSLKAPKGAETLNMVYLRVGYELQADAAYGYVLIRGVRDDNDATAYQGYVVPAPDPSKPGGEYSFPITHMWMGANPKGMRWEVFPGQGVKSARVTTRYSKSKAI